ncbi:MAG: hypothetical protein KBH06_03425 [Spirochaetes bacterium]|nr:hypothetical protein [Spirochaetota bacterium]
MYELLIYFPLLLALMSIVLRNKTFSVYILPVWSIVQTVIIFFLVFGKFSFLYHGTEKYFTVDNLSGLFLIITGFLFIGSSFHSIDALRERDKRDSSFYTFNLLVFVFAINALLMSRHLGLMWVFIEATTLSGAMLIYFEKKHSSIEAAWKYIFICSIGVAFAFIGIIFLSAASTHSVNLFFSELNVNAPSMDKTWLKFGYTFALIGFGTKMGLAPVHSWLPDAHSEAVWPVSAMLSGALLNGAFLAIMKLTRITELAGIRPFSSKLLLVMGILSVLTAAVFVQKTKNYKRLLAYSSIENMGILSLCLYAGGGALFAALIHALGHSLIKASLFLTSGNIYRRYHSKEIFSVSGLISTDRLSAIIWIVSFFCIIASPPGLLFVSEILLFKELMQKESYGLIILLFVLLAAVVYGAAFGLLKICVGEAPLEIDKKRFSLRNYIPQIIFVSIVIILGIYMPASFKSFIDSALEVIIK